MKTLALLLWTALSLGAAPTHAAGTIPLAMSVQVDTSGQIAPGCILYFFQAGTPATPQNSFSDFGLSLNPNVQLTCDQSGRLPMFWLADGLIHVRLTDSFGSPIIDTTMQVLGPSSGGGGGGGTVDPTTIASTGDLKWRLDKTSLTGWVRINGLTIGSSTSGATERANADVQALFVYIWTTFSQPSGNVICPVVGGIGSSALADFNANKQITLEDGRARGLFALDDMGNTAKGGFAGVAFQTGNATIGGSTGGTNATTQTLAQLPTGIASNGSNLIIVNPNGSNAVAVPGTTSGVANVPVTSSGSLEAPFTSGSWAGITNFEAVINISVASTNTGGQPFPSVPSALLGTLYWKL